MIHTTNTDANGLPAVLEKYGRLTQDEEDELIGAAAESTFDDLGLTTTDTIDECYEVIARIPESLLIKMFQVGGGWIMLHARVQGL